MKTFFIVKSHVVWYNNFMSTNAVLKKIESYLNGEISAEDFSYDFPVTYSFYCHQLDKTDPVFSTLMEKKVKALCRAYDPFNYYNMEGKKIFGEEEFRAAIQAAYEKGKKLI